MGWGDGGKKKHKSLGGAESIPLFSKKNKNVKWVGGDQAANDAARGVRSDKRKKKRGK